MKYTHILWDFNGTILDDVCVGIKCINEMLSKRFLPTLNSVNDYYNHFQFPIIEYYKSVGFDFEREPYYEILAPEWVNLYNKYVNEASIRKGVIECVKALGNTGVKQVIISATEYNMLKNQLIELDIIDLFDDFIGLDNIHASSKVSLSLDWYKKEKPKSAIFIGDTVHDYEVANALGCDCILVSGGHQAKNKLSLTSAAVLDDFNNLCSYLLNS